MNTRRRRWMIIFLLPYLVTGCSMLDVKPGNPEYAPAYPTPPVTSPNSSGSIYQSSPLVNLYQDRRAYRIGDILTVRLIETTTAKKAADTNTERNTTITSPAPTLAGNTINQLSTTAANDTKMQGTANSDQSNNLVGTITVSVYRVLPNGNLMIRGEKWITINQGNEYIRLTGIVRPDDIDSSNGIDSTAIANAHIEYSGTGQLAEVNSAGWLTRVFGGAFKDIFPY